MEGTLFISIMLMREKSKSPVEVIRELETLKPGLFTPLLDGHGFSELDVRYIIFYIAYTYSMDSPFVLSGENLSTQKEGIFGYLGIPDTLRGALLELKSEPVRFAIVRYLDGQADRDWKEYKMLCDMYEQMSIAQYCNSHDKEGVVNAKELLELQKSKDEMRKQIEEAEGKMRKKYDSYLRTMEDIRRKGQTKTQMSIEDKIK